MTFKTENPRPGDLGLVHIQGVVGAAIWAAQYAIGSGSYFTHVFVVGDADDAYQAQPGGAINLSLADAVDGRRVVYSDFALIDEQRTAIVAAARSRVGTGYSGLDYPAIGAARLLHFDSIERYVGDTGHMICSVYGEECYYQAGITLFPNRIPGDVVPGDVARLIGAK